MRWADYLMLRRLNFSALKQMARSPRHYRAALESPVGDTVALRVGRLVHALTLEPQDVGARYAVYPGRRAGTEWEAFRSANAARAIVTQSEWDGAQAVAAAVIEQAGQYVSGGAAEQTILWVAQHAREAKGRIDYIHPEFGVIDLKTTVDASPRAVAAAVVRYGYHAQAAWYVDGFRAAHGLVGEDVPYRIVAAEKAPPYAVAVYVLPPEAIAAGRALYRSWLAKLDECEAGGEWPSYTQGEQALELPQWALYEREEENVE